MKILMTLMGTLPLAVVAQVTFTPGGANVLPANYMVYNIKPMSDQVVWATASDASSNGTVKVCLTVDAGTTWNAHDVDNSLIGFADDIVPIDAQTAYVNIEETANGNTHWYVTHNAGSNWTALSNFGTVLMWKYNSADAAMVAGGLGAYSTDTLKTATTVLWNQSGGPPKLMGMGFQSGAEAKCKTDSGIFFCYAKGYVVRTQDMGKTWQGFNTGLSGTQPTASLATDGSSILVLQRAIGGSAGLAVAGSGGNSWTSQTSALPTGIHPEVLASIPGLTGYFVIGADEGLYISKNAGQSWDTLSSAKSISHTGCIAFSSASTAWLGGSVSTGTEPIVYRVSGPPLSTHSNVSEQAYRVYPNPAQGILNIDTKESGQWVLYDVYGRMVDKGSLTPGANHIALKPVSSDQVLFLRMQYGDKVYSEKILCK